jgi:hypothetical protein
MRPRILNHRIDTHAANGMMRRGSRGLGAIFCPFSTPALAPAAAAHDRPVNGKRGAMVF